ncbi:recombinase RecT [Pseudomonas aeruginosa]
MSNSNQLVPPAIRTLIQNSRDGFLKMVTSTGNPMNYSQEALYAMQAMLSNDVLAKTALSNPVSFQLAMVQVASSGLTLNPAFGLAYLVPRDGKVIADVSYRGLIKIATDSRAVNLVVAQSVYSLDKFIYRGDNEEPVHQFDPFDKREDRGEFRGVYVKAYLAIGKLLVTAVSAEDIYAARDLSRAYKKGSGPWVTHFHPMCLKTGIKIGRKFWPQTSPALESVIHYLNEEGEEGISAGPVTLDVASREMGVAASQDPTIVMPAMHINPTVDVQPDIAPQVDPHQSFEAPAEVMEQVPVEASVIRTDGVAVNVDPSTIDSKTLDRINLVVGRAPKTRSWNAAEDWINNQLVADPVAHAFALQLLRKAQTEADQAAA